jgi:hypothetical protein
MRRHVVTVLLVTALAATDYGIVHAQRSASDTPAPATSAAPATILIGETWLGLWRNGKVAKRVDEAGWQISAARLSSDGNVIEVAAFANPTRGTQDETATVFRFDAHTLAALGQVKDPNAGNWPPLAAPIGTDEPTLPEPTATPQLKVGETVIADNGVMLLTKAGATLQARTSAGVATGAAHHIAAGEVRAALSPDGSTAATFAKPTNKAKAWPGEAWDIATGKLVATGLSIDDGTGRDNQAARALACLLPQGEGAIFTLVGAPADRVSEFQRFGSGTKPVTLDTPYVMTCVTTR